MRVVLDANVVISTLVTPQRPLATIFRAWEEDVIEILVSDDILQEVDEVIERFVKRKIVSPAPAMSMIRRLHREAVRVTVMSVVDRSPDRKDNRYLACAKDGRADFLITGDKKHLLPLKEFYGTRIVSPQEFVGLLRGKD